MTGDGAQHCGALRHARGGPFSEALEPEPAAASRSRPGARLQPGVEPADGAAPRPAVARGAPSPRSPLDHRDAPRSTFDRTPPAGLLAHLAAVAGSASFERPRGAVARLRTALATSAGGIVVSANRERPSLVVGMRRRSRDAVTWTLPKGTPDPGETTEETALREVGEETGLEVRILEPLGSIEYDFVQAGTRIHKTVHYFLMA